MKYIQQTAVIICLAISLLLQSCANIVPPSGGAKDVTPPILVSISPADSGLNTKPKRIELRFNKFMEVHDLEKNLELSPLLPIPPTVLANKRTVIIKIQDTQLHENTTYRIGLGNALTDNREFTPYKNFAYTFSTGDYFDSLQIKGNTIDAATGKSDSAILIGLYEATESDSVVIHKKPEYAARIDASGNFNFKSLPHKLFKMFAFQDLNNNYIYDYGTEKIGFLNQKVIPDLKGDSLYTFYMFKEVVDTATLSFIDKNKDTSKTSSIKDKTQNDRFAAKKAPPKPPKNNIGYRVNVDTSDLKQRTVDLKQIFTIDLFTELKKLDSAKVYLSYENDGIEVEAIRKLSVDSGKIKLYTTWQSDKVYTLRLVKGWAVDTSGGELPPGKYFFRTKSIDDYATLIVHFGKTYSHDSLAVYIFKGADSIYAKRITDSVIKLTMLEPGSYGMRIIVDNNKNGKWDPGNLFSGLQPERVIPYNSSTIIMKAGWDNEIDFIPASGKPTSLHDKKDLKDKNAPVKGDAAPETNPADLKQQK